MVNFWSHKDSHKRYVRFFPDSSACAAIVDEAGDPVNRGILLTVTSDGFLVRQRNVEPNEAERAGIELDDEYRWKML